MISSGRLPLYASLVRLDKPVGTLLLLWPTLTALWIASGGLPSALLVAVFVFGTFLMRSAGCAINDAADYRFDGYVKRTANRVVARGDVSPLEAVAVSAALCALAALLLLFLNEAAMRLALIAAAVAGTYPLAKRFFPIPQLYLGVAFSFGIPMAFAAALGEVPRLGWLFFVANMLWVVAYDTEYAMVDRDDDVKLGIRSSAIFFGRWDVAAVMACYGGFFSLMLLVGHGIHATWPYYAGWAFGVLCSVYHHLLIRTRTRDGCFAAFRHNNWVGLALFAGTAIHYAT
ncbi:MAG TPA: 4-hydroxybenzoate octaprenyltransferase [Burkholderiaceae bacterium]|nr:4-hydroxybenzoate octaprenyltransferase [Burkholderiaceae bacterium]